MLRPGTTEPVRVTRLSRTSWWTCAAAGIIGLSYLPLLVSHAQFMWTRPHYQYFPLLVPAVAFLAWRRWPSETTVVSGNARLVASILLLLALTSLTFATLTVSHWIASVSAVFMVGATIMWIGGLGAARALWPIWLLCWLFVPIPFEMDVSLINWLQTFAASASSQILDVLGVDHNLAGNVLEMPGRRLLVDEACSGIQSLFSLLACTAFYVVWKRRPWLRALILLASVVLWALLGNSIRLVIVALAYHLFGSDLSSGWPHELLGVVLFAFAFLTVLSTDQLLHFLLAPIGELSPVEHEQSPLSRCWNQLMRESELDAVIPNEEPVAQDSSPTLKRTVAATGGGIAIALAFATLGSAQVATFLLLGEIQVQAADAAEAVTHYTLPEECRGWQQVGFETERRESGNPWGEESKSWTYQGQDHAATVSLDYAFSGWHNLMACYTGTGWNVDRSRAVTSPSAQNSGNTRLVEVELSQPNGQFGYLVYGLFDVAGNDLTPAGSEASRSTWLFFRAKGAIERGLARGPLGVLTGRGAGQLRSVSYQFQIFVPSDSPLTKAQRDEVRGTFVALRDQLRQHWKRVEG